MLVISLWEAGDISHGLDWGFSIEQRRARDAAPCFAVRVICVRVQLRVEEGST